MGSKSKIAEWIVSKLPRATHLYDVFAGGGAVTHCALLSGKWKCVHFSDITNSVELLRDCFEGNLPDGSEWISREDFFARKDENPYIRLLWSFGNDGRTYLYGKDIEPYKKAVHEMIFAPTPNERRLKFREVCKLIPSVLGINGGVRLSQMRVNGEIAEATYRLQHLEPQLPPPKGISYQSECYKTYSRTKPTTESNRTSQTAIRGAEGGLRGNPLFT